MVKFLFLLFLILHQTAALAQISFQIDTTFFKNEHVNKVSAGLDSNVWVVKNIDSSEIGKVSPSLIEEDLSVQFNQFTSSKFNDVLGLDSGIVFVGTKDDYIVRFRNGSFENINELNGLKNSNINSLLYIKKCEHLYPYTPKIAVGSDSGYYISNDRINFDVRHPQLPVAEMKVKYIVQNSDFRLFHVDAYDSSASYATPKYDHISYTMSYMGTQWDRYSPLTTIPGEITQYTSIAVNRAWTPYFPGNLYWGTSQGLKKKSFFSPYLHSTYIPERSVFKLYNLRYFPEEEFAGIKNEECYIFAGTDSGLYYFKLSPDVTEIDIPILVPNTSHLKILDIDADQCNQSLWLATDKGLVKVLLNYPSVSLLPPIIKNSISPSGSVSFCQGQTTTFSTIYNSKYSYQWMKDGINIPYANQYTYTTNFPGVYKVVISMDGCYWNDKVTTVEAKLFLDTIVNISFNYPDTIYTCEDSIVTLHSTINSGHSVQWIKNGMILPGETSQSFQTSDSGFYKVKVSNCNGFSKISDSVYLKVYIIPKPILTISSTPPLCPNDTATIKVSPENYSVIWKKDNDSAILNQNSPYYPATISGSYRAVIKNSHNCSNESDPVSVIFGVSPSVNITSDKVIPYCENDSIVLTANTSSTDIHWSQGTTTKEVTLKQSGTYKVVVNSVDGCTASDSLKVDFWPLPVFDLGSDTSYCEANLSPLIIKAGGGFSYYVWNGMVSQDSLFEIYQAGKYYLKVTNQYGCSANDSIIVFNDCDPMFIPNLITPNKDNKNDFFFIENLVPECELVIYNRWGEQIYKNLSYDNTWSAEGYSSGIYYFTLKNEYYKKEWNGWIHILQ